MYQPLTAQQYQAARSAGYSADQIIANEQKRKAQQSAPSPDQPTSLWGKIKGAFQNRVQGAQVAQEQAVAGNQSLGSGVLQTLGQGAGFVNDLVGMTAKPAFDAVGSLNAWKNAHPAAAAAFSSLPGFSTISRTADVATAGAKAAAPAADELASHYGQWKQNHPEAAGNIEAAANLASILPVGEGAGAAARGTEAGVKALPGAMQAVKPAMQGRVIDQLEQAYRDAAGATMPTRKLLSKSEARGKDPARFLAERNIAPEVEAGKIKTTTQADTLHETADPLNNHLDMALEEAQHGAPLVNIETLRARALKNADSIPNITETARKQIKAHINEEYDLQKEKLGPKITLKETNGIKRANWRATKFDATKPYQGDANYQVGKAAQQAIEESVPKEALPIHELNSHIGDIYDAEKFLRGLDGRAVKGGRLGRYFARMVGGAIGSSHGPIGTFAGTLGGDAVSQILQKTTFSNPLKQMIVRNLSKGDPAAHLKVMEYLKKAGLDRETRPLLPAPNPKISKINQGRPIPVLPARNVDYIGPETATKNTIGNGLKKR